MIIHVTAYSPDGEHKYRAASKDVTMPAVPPKGAWIEVDELNDQFRVEDVFFSLSGTVGISLQVANFDRIDTLIGEGWIDDQLAT